MALWQTRTASIKFVLWQLSSLTECRLPVSDLDLALPLYLIIIIIRQRKHMYIQASSRKNQYLYIYIYIQLNSLTGKIDRCA